MTTTVLPAELSTRLARLGGELSWIVAGQAAAAAGTLVGVRVLTGALSPASYGELALALTAVTLAHQVVMSPLVAGVMRFYAPAQAAAATAPYFAAVRLLLCGSVLGIAVVTTVAVLGTVAIGAGVWPGLVVGAAAVAALAGWGAALDGVQTAARHRAVVAWHQALMHWARPLLAVGLITLVGASSLAAIWGYVLASAGVLGSQIILFRRRFDSQGSARPEDVAQEARRIWGYSWPFATWGVLTWCQSASDRYALQWFVDTEAVGLYFVASQLGVQPMMLVATAIMQLVSPILFREAGGSGDRARLQRALHLNSALCAASLVATLVAALLVAMVGDRIFAWLVATEYRGASVYFGWLVLAGGLYATGQVASQSLMIATETSSLIAPKVVTAVLGTALNVVGAALNGIGGVVAANVAFGAIYLGWVAILAWRRSRRVRGQ